MNLDEVQAAGRFAWHPERQPDLRARARACLWLLVDEGGLIYDILKPKRALPAWALAGWRHERTCPCDLCAKDYPIAAATAEPTTTERTADVPASPKAAPPPSSPLSSR